MKTMHTTRICNSLRVALKHSALAVAVAAALGSAQAVTPRSFTGSPITENFDGLGTAGTAVTLLTGWDAGHFSTYPQQGITGGNGLTTVTDPLVVDDGNFGTGGAPILANFGTTGAADRALGTFARTTPAGDQFLQLAITNDTASPITTFELTYTGEEWRSSATPVQQLTLWYSATDATSGFVSMGAGFAFNSPNNSGSGVIDGNATGNRTVISGTFTPATPIAPGSTIYIRWYDINDSGIADDFLAIDDLSFGLVAPAANILTFGPGAYITGTNIAWFVPNGTDVTSLMPTYTLSPDATCDHDNGITAYNFSSPAGVDYVVSSAAPVITKTYNVKVTVLPLETTLLWNGGSASWDLAVPNWKGLSSGMSMPFFNGADVRFNNAAGGTITIASGMSPVSTTVSAGDYTFNGQPIATGSLTKSGGGQLSLNVTPANFSSIALQGGSLYLHAAETGFAPNGASFNMPNVTVEPGATLIGERASMVGSLTMNGGRYFENNGWSGSWTGPVYLTANSFFGQNGWCQNQTINGVVSGTGGFTFSTQYNAAITLTGANTYTGPTTIHSGTLIYNSAADQSLPGALSGAGNLTKAGSGMLTFTGVVSHTGLTTLTAGTLVLNNPAAQTLTGVISGAGALTQAGPGSLTLPNINTYTGTTTVSGGTLLVTGSTSVASAVSVASGATLGGTGTIQGDVTVNSGAMLVLSSSAPLTFKKLTLNNNVVHLNLSSGMVDGVYPLATYIKATSSGAVDPVPVIDSGSSLIPGTAMSVAAVDGIVTLTVGNPPIAILPVTIPNGTTNAPYSQALSAAGGFGAPYQNYAVVSGALPDGLTLSTGGLISGTPTTLGTFTFAVQVQDQYGYLADVPKSYTMSIVLMDTFSWVMDVSGDWSDYSMWSNNGGVIAAPAAAGQTNYTLNFTRSGAYTATHNLNDGFLLNQLNFAATVTLAGTNGLTLTNNGATLPGINQNSTSTVAISTPVSLAAVVAVGGSGNGHVALTGLISGTGGLTKNNAGTLQLYGLVPNTYSGATIVNSGTLHLGAYINGISPYCLDPAGSGPVTLNAGTIEFDRVNATNALTANGGTLYSPNGWGADWSGPITLNAAITFNAGYRLTCSGGISGAGGVIKTGNSELNISGTISYTGDTAINAGTVVYSSTTSQTLAGNISGPGNLSKTGIGSLTFTGLVSYAGTTTLTGGTLVFNSAAAQTLAGVISGAGALTQAGPGSLTLSNINTYTGVTTVSGGSLVVNGSSISDSGKLVINTGGKVEATGTETVNTMYFGTTPKAVGTWGATGSGATFIDDAHFSGTAGVVNVLTMGVGIITGKVTLEDGTTPVVGAKINAVGVLLTSNTLTLADGTYFVDAQIGDTVTVTATKRGYAVTDPVSTLYTILTATDPMTDINFRMAELPISQIVNLKAKDLAVGPITEWANTGTAGGVFTTIAGSGTAPEVKDVGGVKAVAITAGYGLASSMNTPAAITGDSPWTIAAWVYRSADLPWQGTEECIIGLGNSGGNYDLLMLNYSSDPDWGYIDSGVFNFGSSTPPARGAWHNIVATYDGVTVHYYADKELLRSGVGSLRTPAQPMTIGFVYQGDGTSVEGWSRSWANMASIEIYDGALSKTAIDALYDTGIALPSYSTWATSNGIGGEPASGDFDNDGLSNLMEYALGTDPKVSSGPTGIFDGNVVTFTKGSAAIANGDVSWVIEESNDLGRADPWAPVVSQPAGDPSPTISHTLPAGHGKVFARLVVTQP